MIAVETTRICKVCHIDKPIEEFPKLQGKWRYRACKKCYYTLHRGKIIDSAKRYYAGHKPGVLAKLHTKYFAGYGEIRKKRSKKYYKEQSANNREVYGTACSPSRLADVREYNTSKRTDNKMIDGYAKPPQTREQERLHYIELRKQALTYYGGKCECCGEPRCDMLTFDHKIQTKHKVRGVALTYGVIREYEKSGYPNAKYRVLCWNCNIARGFYGYCPHKTQRDWVDDKRRTLKLEMIEAYGGVCVLCGETYSEFLTIDHINGNGSEHRRSIGNKSIYAWLKEQGWPQGEYRLLCANCNCSDKRNKWNSEKARKEVHRG